jgi:putative two-component system response regulator
VGAASYMIKSNTKKQLLDRVKEILDRNSLLRGRTILIVDDSPVVRNLIEKALTKAGFHVIAAENGRKALELLSRCSPDMILSDLHMPELDGSDLCKNVHANKDLSQIPFIVMSSDGDRATMRRLLQYGASAYLVKPFNIDQLVVTAERFLSDHFGRILKERERLESERQFLIGSITSLILALEARDQYTRGHSESVSIFLVDIAREMSLDEDRMERVKIAGKLHDLGKIGIRDDILLKPGPLNDEEWKILKLHPLIGAEILAPIQSLADIIPAIASHHERIDGKGYPEGLKGDRIPLLARMVAVADTYDALTSDRPYRKGFSNEDALTLIEDLKGSQLCPDCVQCFLKSVQKGMQI